MLLSADKSVDMSPMMPVIVKLLAHSDLLIKKTACHFLCTQSGCQSEQMMMAVNTLLKDFSESNPMIRGLALKTLCTVQHDAFSEHRLGCISKGLEDNSAYVRRAAVMACLSIHRSSCDSFTESGLVDKLYSLIRDPDPVVVVNSLVVLEEVLKDEGGVVVNKNIVYYLLNKISTFTSWGIGYTLLILKKYTPKTEDEIFDMMNLLDSYLQNNSCTVCIQALELFLNLTKELPHLSQEIFQRSLNSFLSVISSGNVEVMAVVLEYLENHLGEVSSCLREHYKSFFCRHKDPEYLKKKKIMFLIELITAETKTEILDEINMYCYDKCRDVSLCAIKALGKIIKRYPEVSQTCLKMVKKLLQSETEHLLSNTLHVLVSLSLEKDDVEILADQIFVISKSLSDEKGKCAALNLIGQYCGDNPESTYVIEDFIENFEEEESLSVKSQLLLTTLQLFSENPAELQSDLGELLELCMNDTNQCIKDQASFYYNIISSDVRLLNELFTKN